MRHKLVKVKNIISLSSAFQESKDSALAVPRMGLLYGFTGIGKTTATAWLVNKENGIYVRATSVWSPSAMLQEILLELSIDPPSLPAKMLTAVKEQMKLRRRPLFIDEADYLLYNPKMLQIARDIHSLLAKELCEIDIHEDLLVKLHELSNGSIRLITVGLSRVEAFTKAQRWQCISAQQWSGRPFFLSRQM